MRKQTIVQATALVTAITLGSKLLGFVREQIVAHYFGATGATDAFLVAQTLPVILATIVLATIGIAFLPVFSEKLNDGPEGAWRLANSLFTLTGLVALATAIFGVAAAPWLVRLLAPGFSGETFTLAVLMMRIIFPGVLFGALIVPARAVLNAHHDFAAPAAAPLAQNAVTIAVVVGLAGAAGFGVAGLAAGWLAGYVLSFLIQLPALRQRGFRYRFRLALTDPDVRRTLTLVLPLLAGAAFSQLYVLVDRSLASGLPAGSIAALNFADKLRLLPNSIFAAAVATVVFPRLAELATGNDRAGLKDMLGSGLRLVALLTLPAALGLAVLRLPLVRVLFQHGAFDAAASAATSGALLWYSLGMIGLAVTQVLSTTFYSLRDTITPVLIGGIGTLVNVGLDYALVGSFGIAGLAIANAASATVTMVLLFVFLQRKLGSDGFRRTAVALAKITVAALAMAAVVAVAMGVGPLGDWLAATQPRRLQIMAAGGLLSLGILVYFAIVIVLRVEETAVIWQAIARKLRRAR